MIQNLSIEQLTEERVNKGLINCWYPVLPSWRVAEAPVGITRLSEKICVWRDGNGEIHAIEDRCPHRGARLSLGWNLGENIACWYHGIEINDSGSVTKVPAQTNCPLVGKTCIKSYPAQEKQGAIFLFFGDELHSEPCLLDLPKELSSDEYSSFLCTAAWKVNYRYAIDNVMDPMHGAYLHAESHSMAFGDKSTEMKIRKTETGLFFEKVGQAGVNFDWVEMGDTGGIWLRLAIPYQKKYGPGGSFGIVGFATPLDEKHCMVFFWRTRKIQGWKKDVWRFLYKTRLEELHWHVLEQDRTLLEQMADDAREHEFLYQHDVGLSRVRRMMEKKAKEQVKELMTQESQ